MSDTKSNGPLGWCVEYVWKPSGCAVGCLSGMSAMIGRFIAPDPDLEWEGFSEDGLSGEDRSKILANAAIMERLGRGLREAVAWVEAGHNGSVRADVDDVLTKGLRRSARGKPDSGGNCNGNVCILAAAQMVEDGMVSAQCLTQAIGALELKRILKAAHQLEENADDLRAAVS